MFAAAAGIMNAGTIIRTASATVRIRLKEVFMKFSFFVFYCL